MAESIRCAPAGSARTRTPRRAPSRGGRASSGGYCPHPSPRDRSWTLPLVALILIVGLVGAGARWAIPPFPSVMRWWRRARPWVAAYIASAPATFLYLLVIATTSWVLASSGGPVDAALLRGHSSNLAALAQDPLRGLVQSAFWVQGWPVFLAATVLGIALAPVERWLGTTRWLVVFATGHVVTSLLVAGAIWTAIDSGHASPGLREVVDVGASYGLAAVGGVAVYRLPRRLVLPVAAGVLTVLAAVLAAQGTFTDLGHVLAFALGLACRPLTRSAAVRERARGTLLPRPADASPH